MKKLIPALLGTMLATGAFAQEAAPQAPAPKKEIFRTVEQNPEPGYDLMAYINENMHYPAEAKKAGIEGRVYVSFVINEDGSISDADVVKGKELGYGLPEEAKRVIMSLPKWTPGKQNGRAVNVYFTLPLAFKLK
ncbi:Gram-negative bacterial tonB protein [compost metagenome]